MDDFAVTCIIATIWASLGNNLGTHIGFGTADMFLIRSKADQQTLRRTACGQHDEMFIMPLFFPSDEQQHSTMSVPVEVEVAVAKVELKARAKPASPRVQTDPRTKGKPKVISQTKVLRGLATLSWQ